MRMQGNDAKEYEGKHVMGVGRGDKVGVSGVLIRFGEYGLVSYDGL